MLVTNSTGVDEKREERREARVCFAIKSDHVKKLSGLPKCINDRLMTLRHILSGNKDVTNICAFASTMTNPNEVEDNFYDDFCNTS